jgi:hypothetical protein
MYPKPSTLNPELNPQPLTLNHVPMVAGEQVGALRTALRLLLLCRSSAPAHMSKP